MIRTENAARCTWVVALALLMAALPALAEKGGGLGMLFAEDWQETQAGVWQRSAADGSIETKAVGPEGLAYGLDLLRAQLTTLSDVYLTNPTKESLQALEDHTRFIERLELGMVVAPRAAAPAPKANCDYYFSLGADAGPFSPPHCGAGASAYADYLVTGDPSCDDECTVYTYTYWRHECGTQTLTGSLSCSDTGTDVGCSIWDHAPYTPDDSIYTYAYSYIYCPSLNSLFLYDNDSADEHQPWCQTC